MNRRRLLALLPAFGFGGGLLAATGAIFHGGQEGGAGGATTIDIKAEVNYGNGWVAMRPVRTLAGENLGVGVTGTDMGNGRHLYKLKFMCDEESELLKFGEEVYFDGRGYGVGIIKGKVVTWKMGQRPAASGRWIQHVDIVDG